MKEAMTEWLYIWLRNRFEIDEMLENYDESKTDFKERIVEALEELGVLLRLEYIDQDTLLEWFQNADPNVMADYGPEYGSEWGFSREAIANVIQSIPTIDPVYAAGACYCYECKYSSESGGFESAEQTETHVNCLKFLTPYHRVSIMPKNGFCSYGERKNRKDA